MNSTVTGTSRSPPVIVAISGASGAVLGVETLRALKEINVPAHLVVTQSGARTLAYEMDMTLDDVRQLADVTYANKDVGAAIASGSFRTRGMIVAPCSIKTLSAIASSFAHNLTTRAADVCLKERRPLVLQVRETPLHQGHLELMLRAARIGCIIAPPMLSFYTKPQNIDDMVRHTVGRALDALGLDHDLSPRWNGEDI